ncbi:MAG: hypothetical protein AB7N73_00470 [Gemmatimonadales bacterium]
MTDQRDWDRELAKIDRLMEKAPAAPPPEQKAPVPATKPAAGEGRAAAAPAPAPRTAPAATPRGGGVRVWGTALLGPLGAVALLMWPYGTRCGPMLWVYLVGVAAVGGAAIMAMRAAWQHRRGGAMTLGILTLVAALALAAAQVLPRIGYAQTALTWTCTT